MSAKGLCAIGIARGIRSADLANTHLIDAGIPGEKTGRKGATCKYRKPGSESLIDDGSGMGKVSLSRWEHGSTGTGCGGRRCKLWLLGSVARTDRRLAGTVSTMGIEER